MSMLQIKSNEHNTIRCAVLRTVTSRTSTASNKNHKAVKEICAGNWQGMNASYAIQYNTQAKRNCVHAV